MNIYILSLCLGTFGIAGIIAFLILTGLTFWYYRNYRMGSFQWHLRNLRLKQLAAVACMFFLAMAASYTVLLDAWAILYLLIAIKAGTWWFRFAITQRA